MLHQVSNFPFVWRRQEFTSAKVYLETHHAGARNVDEQTFGAVSETDLVDAVLHNYNLVSKTALGKCQLFSFPSFLLALSLLFMAFFALVCRFGFFGLTGIVVFKVTVAKLALVRLNLINIID